MSERVDTTGVSVAHGVQTLAETGANVGLLIALAVLLVLIGLGSVLLARRRANVGGNNAGSDGTDQPPSSS